MLSVQWRELLTSKGWAKYSSVGLLSSLASLIKRLTPILGENNTTNYLILMYVDRTFFSRSRVVSFSFSEFVRTVFIPPRIDNYLDFADYIWLPSPNWSEKEDLLMKQSNLERTFHFHFPTNFPLHTCRTLRPTSQWTYSTQSSRRLYVTQCITHNIERKRHFFLFVFFTSFLYTSSVCP